MTYANDCIQIKKSELKNIRAHTYTELNRAVERAARKFGDDFWILLHGIDAYMERRKRRQERKEIRIHHQILNETMGTWPEDM